MQRDLQKGGPSEINDLLFEVIRMGKRYQIELPTYEMIAHSMGYSEAFAPMWLGDLQLRNHLVRSATRDGVENEDGTVSERQLQIMRTLASHEVGLIITGHFYVHPQGQASPSQNGIYDGRFLPGMRRMVDAVHMEEGSIVAQLNHAGGNADGEEPLAPSERVYSKGRLARALTREEMNEIRDCFAEGASRAYQAGFDGVQIHMAHDYLLSEFLTPMMNTRTDEYGGSAENRFRFSAEIIEAVRRATSETFPILVKINSNVQANDRQYEEDLLYYLQQMESLGVAAAELSGCDFTKKGANERTYYLERAARMQQQLTMPLILVGGVRSLQDIAKVIDAGIPMVSLSRPLICQGDLIPRLLSGERARCISCNQCFALPRTRGIRCVFHAQGR
jgi:2,4-dienoyl-CoA reductase-like NADH-dependent reductase (Old Yellow Enzyme family)